MAETADKVNIRKLCSEVLDELGIKPHCRGIKLDYHGNVTIEFIDGDMCRRRCKIRTEEFRSSFGRDGRIRHIIRAARMFT